MKVIAFQSDTAMIVSMTVEELLNLAGFSSGNKFNEAFDGAKTTYGTSVESTARKEDLIRVEDIPVGTIFKDARETLEVYSGLKKNLDSVRSKLQFLLKKMKEVTP